MHGASVLRISHVFALLACVVVCAGPTAWSSTTDDWRELLRTINDENATFEERLAAEEALIQFDDPEILREVFGIIAEPVGRWTSERPIPTAHHPRDAWRQIVVARIRIFAHFAKNAAPAEERNRIFLELFADNSLELTRLISHSRSNWTVDVRKKLLVLYADKELSPKLRESAGWTLLDMHNATPRSEHVRNREMIIENAWNERGTDFARSDERATWIS